MAAPAEAPDGDALVADLCSGERDRVLHAVWAIVATRDPAVLQPIVDALPRIRTATDDLDLGGAFVSNRLNLERSLAYVERFAAGECFCTAYDHGGFFQPEREAARGHVRIVEVRTTPLRGRETWPRDVCECTACGRRFDVEHGESHYPWWQWHDEATLQAEAAQRVPTPPTPVTNPRSPARARRRRSSPSA